MRLLDKHNKAIRASEMSAVKDSKKFSNPTKDDVHTDSVLSGVSVMYKNDDYVADQVMPVVPVSKESDIYYEYTRNWRLPEAKRAPGSEAAEVEWNVETKTYSCIEYALKDIVPDRVRDNMDNPLDADVDTTEAVTDLIQLLREKRIADEVFAAGNHTNTSALTGGNQWDDYAASSPIEDVQDGKDAVHGESGKVPNTMIVGKQVHSKLLHHPDILERTKYTQGGSITPAILARLFEVDNYYIGQAMYDSSQEGGTESLGYVWGKYAALIYAEPAPGLKKVSWGYQFQSRGFRTKSWREEARDGDWVECGEIRDEKIVSADCGYLYSTVVS